MATAGRTAAIVGATGLVGGHLLRQLIEDPAYTRIVALVRKAPEVTHPKLEVRQVDFDHLAEQGGALDVHDAFCALGTTIRTAGSKEAFAKVDFGYVHAFAKLARPSATQFLLVSAYGASSRSSVFYNRTKGQVEDAIRALELGGAHFFRPSFLEGERAERRVGERIGSAAARVLGAIPLSALRRLRPIAAKDVARAMIHVAKRDLRGAYVYESDQIQALADGASP